MDEKALNDACCAFIDAWNNNTDQMMSGNTWNNLKPMVRAAITKYLELTSCKKGQSTEMTHDEKIQWMAVWAAKNGLQLNLEGECGFGRECVGVSVDNSYPDYHWYDNDYNRADKNGDVWKPKDAYHKHECVAVLGRGEDAEKQLYEWLVWFDSNGFKLETGSKPVDQDLGAIAILLGQHRYAHLVRPE